MTKMMLVKLIVSMLLLTSGCGDSDTSTQTEKYNKPRIITEQTLIEETLIEEVAE